MSETLAEARDQLREQALAGEAVRCPCCTQLVKVYKRTIHHTMARALILMYRTNSEWMHVPNVTRSLSHNGGGDTTKLAYWGLITPMPGDREDGSHRTGWWKITDQGKVFVLGVGRVPKFAHIYDGRVLQLDGPLVSIRECLGSKFNYEELMGR